MSPRHKALAHLVAAVYFAACMFAARADADVPAYVQAVAAWGMGASLGLSVMWWGRAS